MSLSRRHQLLFERHKKALDALCRWEKRAGFVLGKLIAARKKEASYRAKLAALEEEVDALPCCGEFGTGSNQHGENCAHHAEDA